MYIFPAQLEGYRSRSTGDRLVTFCTYEDNAGDIAHVIQSKIGTEYLVMLIPTGSTEHSEFVSEDKTQTVERFRKRMNALIGQIADEKDMEHGRFRDMFKEHLKKIGLIKESTKELDLEGYAKVIALLLTKVK